MKERTFESEDYLAFFKEVASVHDKKASRYLRAEKAVLVDTVVSIAESKRGALTLLDLGAGTGRIMNDLLERVRHVGEIQSVALVESSPDMLALCKRKLTSVGIDKNRISFFNMTVEEFTQTHKLKYDIVLVNLLCSVCGLSADFFKRVYSITHVAGIVVFRDIHPIKIGRSPFFELVKARTLYRLKLKGYSVDTFIRQIVEAGFHISTIMTINDSRRSPYSLIVLMEKRGE